MRKISQVIIPIAIGLLAFGAGRYFFPPAPTPPTGQISCAFLLSANTPPVRSANSSIEVSRVDLTAQLTNLSKHDGVLLWHADGTAMIGGQSRVMSGVVFLNPNRTVRGMGLWQDRPGQDGDKLRIMTLNTEGVLDWNETSAYAYFETESNKLAHPFSYKCKTALIATTG